MKKHILMVVTTADKMNEEHKTGLWLSEFGEAYAEFDKAGFEITVASPLGGQVPIDERSLQGDVLSDFNINAKEIDLMADRAMVAETIGSYVPLKRDDVKEILRNSL